MRQGADVAPGDREEGRERMNGNRFRSQINTRSILQMGIMNNNNNEQHSTGIYVLYTCMCQYFFQSIFAKPPSVCVCMCVSISLERVCVSNYLLLLCNYG